VRSIAAACVALSCFASCAAACGAIEERAHEETCADVGAVRACWRDGEVIRLAREAGPPEEDIVSSAFDCGDDHCVQRHVALPDENVWECRIEAGALICLELAKAAGAVSGPIAAGFRCAARPSNAEQRVCMDLAPDRPDDRSWDCDIAHERGERMRCERHGDTGPQVGDSCDGVCPSGSSCTSAACLPHRHTPECWDERDCGGDRCALGACQR
jgi:hypothetical protein